MPRDASVLDFGGGNGLLCRLLRDRGFNARVLDAYATNDFAQGFDDDGSIYNLVCAFEVAEHFADPKTEMTRIFQRSKAVVIIGTVTYEGQGADWWYFIGGGQHVFFYAKGGMKFLAAMHGYHYEPMGNTHIFLKRSFAWAERTLLSKLPLKRVRSYLAYSAPYYRALIDSNSFNRKVSPS
jgi:2-polyprenyl-3-methyl-5-hydroxy-6-metoxy-1,4-benzoquinol methylase